jgi:purine-nucleoside phosphorylase
VSTNGFPGPGDDLAARAAAVVRASCDLIPSVGLVLGSGLGPAIAEVLQEETSFAYAELPGFPTPGVPGHAGRLILGRLAGAPVAAFSGRLHFYEGHGMDVPALLPRLARALGARTMILASAVGGLVATLAAGTLVVLTDHLNMMGAAPLRGWRYPDGTPAFVGMRDVYDASLGDLAIERALARGVLATRGVYGAMSGPAYETPTEVAFLRQAGATVVGMSVVPEAMPARALGMRVLGLCSVTNALGDPVAHEDVVRVSNDSAHVVGKLLADLLPRIADGTTGDRQGA